MPDPQDASIPAAEATIKLVEKIDDEPVLARQRDLIVAFYKPEAPEPFFAQVEALPGNRRAILLQGKQGIDPPLVMVIDANGTRAWTKERPLVGITSPVRDMAIVRGAESSVGVAFCDATGHRAALRMWHYDGSINADFEVMEVPHCDNISAVFIPGVGHVLASTGETTARIGMIAANGMRAWDAAGIDVPWTALRRTALSIAVDTEDSFIVVGVSITEGKTEPRDAQVLAMRYDMRGRELWKAPITLGKRPVRSWDRLRTRVTQPKAVEVVLEEKPLRRVALSADGVVVPLK